MPPSRHTMVGGGKRASSSSMMRRNIIITAIIMVLLVILQLLAWSSRKAPRSRKHIAEPSHSAGANASLGVRSALASMSEGGADGGGHGDIVLDGGSSSSSSAAAGNAAAAGKADLMSLSAECERLMPWKRGGRYGVGHGNIEKEEEGEGQVEAFGNSADAYRALRCGCIKYEGQGKSAEWIKCQMRHSRNMTLSEVGRLERMDGVGTGAQALEHTKAILRFGTRVPGEEGWRKTVEYIEREVKKLASWKLEKDCWTATTPIGPKPMCNIIATFNPSADHCLIDLAAHHESKFFTSQRFLGAIDSAAPVGIMLEIAHALTPLLEAKLSAVGSAGTPCLRLIFFDGEEAFVSWTEEDSLYGARRIADQWSQGDEPRLNTMRTLVLLDLLGAKQPALTWHFENTRPLYGGMQSVESKLRNLSLLRGQGGRRPTRRVSYPDRVGGEGDRRSAGDQTSDARAVIPYMSSNGRRGGLSDDHVPFMRKGIPVVHLIDSPFPSIWHTDRDNLEAVDPATLGDLTAIIKAFVVEYYALEP